MSVPTNGSTTPPAPRILSRVLLIETTTDNDGVREVETREATEEEMGELGWVRASDLGAALNAAAFDKQETINAMAMGMAGALGVTPKSEAIPDLDTNGHAPIGKMASGESVTVARRKPSVDIRFRAHAKAEKRGDNGIQSDTWYALMDWLDEHFGETT